MTAASAASRASASSKTARNRAAMVSSAMPSQVLSWSQAVRKSAVREPVVVYSWEVTYVASPDRASMDVVSGVPPFASRE